MAMGGQVIMRFVASLVLLLLAPLAPMTADAQPVSRASSGQKWVVAWVGSIQGPYPVGNPSAQPEMKLAFPSDEVGARDQSFRMILKPEIWDARRACGSRTCSARSR